MTPARLLADLCRAGRAWRSRAPGERGVFAEAWLLLLWYGLRWRAGLCGKLLARSVTGAETRLGGGVLEARRIDPGAVRVLAAFATAANSHVVRTGRGPGGGRPRPDPAGPPGGRGDVRGVSPPMRRRYSILVPGVR
jgi:hypothetical protein